MNTTYAKTFTYSARPEATWLRVLGGVAIAIVVLVVVAAIGVAVFLYNAFGGTAHEATDKTVTAARVHAKAADANHIAHLVQLLAPTLGQPTRRASSDGCMANDPDNYLSNDIKCELTYALYYPVAAAPPKASVIAGVIATDAGAEVIWPYDRDGFSSKATVSYPGGGMVNVTSHPSAAKDGAYICGSAGFYTPVEKDGCDELRKVLTTGTYVVVEFSDYYFFG